MSELFDSKIVGNNPQEAFNLSSCILQALSTHSIIGIDKTGKIWLWGEGARRLFGYESETVVGKATILNLYPQETLIQQVIDLALQEGRWEGVINCLTKTGSHVKARTTVIPHHNVAKEHIGFLILSNDISSEHICIRKLKKTQGDLKNIKKELQLISHVASHDLQEPLRMISSYTQLLAKRYRGRLDATADEFIQFTVDGASRMQTLIDDLMQYIRILLKAKIVTLTDSNQILKTILQEYEEEIKAKHILISHDNLPKVKTDKDLFKLVFKHLIGNAIKFNSAPNKIHIGVIDKGAHWQFSVEDSGIGIAEKYFQKIFVLFQRLHSKNLYPGNGIGLAICKKAVELCGGLIWIESTPGQGTIFFFTVPKLRRQTC